ncbi:MAG: hypothetical protein ABJA67_00805 [Chthonomonadales bacterium]
MNLLFRVAFSVVALSALLQSPSISQTAKKTNYLVNTRSGQLFSIDPTAATLILKPRIGVNVTYRYSEKTQFVKNFTWAEPIAFKPGDPIVVRFRKGSVGPSSATDVVDKASFDWLNRIRHEPVQVMIKEISEESLLVTDGPTKAEIEYKLSEKTTYTKGGKAATLADFKVGETVHVIPRSLPGGNLQAIAVADIKVDAIHLKERSKLTVTGTIRAIDLKKMILSFRSTTGDDRDFEIAEECVATQLGKPIALTQLHAGLNATIHLTRREEDSQVVTKITVHSKKSSTRKPVIRKPLPDDSILLPKPVGKKTPP